MPAKAVPGYGSEATELNRKSLQAKRIVAYDGADRRSRPYDMLRTQVLQTMDANRWKVLAVTSPTPKCGKTVTAINLAFSITRQPDRSVVLLDLDLQWPRISGYFGLVPQNDGVLGIVEGRASPVNVAVTVRAKDQQMVVFPTAATRQSAELMCSGAMTGLLEDLKASFQTVILDLPPILSSDDVIALLPQVDCVLLVAAVGVTKASEIEECIKFLPPGRLTRVVLNKVPVAESTYYSYG